MLYNQNHGIQNKIKLPFYFTTDVSLINYTTTKSDNKKNLLKFPQFQPVYMEPQMPEEFQQKIKSTKKGKHKNNQEEKDKEIEQPKEIPAQCVFIRKNKRQKVTLNSFNLIKVLGRGSYGKVMLVQHKISMQYYAMKSLKKDQIIDKYQIENTLSERQILETSQHPFLVNLEFAFQTDTKLFLIMNFQKGGELFTHLRNFKRFSEYQAKFYMTQIIMALGYLHSQNIVYRDLKPENIMLDEYGYTSLTDYGQSKKLKRGELTNSFCGSPEYLSPEMVLGNGHNQTTDWWSLGILLYEMLYSIPPFYQKNQDYMYQMIVYAPVKFPKQIELSEECKDIIQKLLIKDKSKRFGSKGDIEEIKQHPWFNGINWKAIYNRNIKSPFIPKTNGNQWISNFDSQYTNQDATNSDHEADKELIDEYNDMFKDFTFVQTYTEVQKRKAQTPNIESDIKKVETKKAAVSLD